MEKTVKQGKRIDVRKLVFTALMAAVSYLLANLDFNIPIMPFFIKFDFSDVPAVLAALTMGPVSGIFVCLIKNAIGCFTSSTACIGELSNFILGIALVIPTGLISHKQKQFSRAVIGCIVGVVTMTLLGGFVSNYFLIYPLYSNIGMPIEAIVSEYQKINPNVDTLAECLLIFNVPFTFVKGLIAATFSVLLYKRLRPIFNSMYREK